MIVGVILQNHDKLKVECKKYKTVLNKKSMHAFDKAFNKKLRLLRNANSKEYWKMLCTSNKKENVDTIQMQVWTEYFKKLNVDDNT